MGKWKWQNTGGGNVVSQPFTSECGIDFYKVAFTFTEWKLCYTIYVQLKQSCIIKNRQEKFLGLEDELKKFERDFFTWQWVTHKK